jgi:hypothetical protein
MHRARGGAPSGGVPRGEEPLEPAPSLSRVPSPRSSPRSRSGTPPPPRSAAGHLNIEVKPGMQFVPRIQDGYKPNAPPSTRITTPMPMSTTGNRTWPHLLRALATTGRLVMKYPAAHHTAKRSRKITP